MAEPIRIAQIIGDNARGGVEAVVFNYYRHMKHDEIQFDFLISDRSKYEVPDDIVSSGANVFKIPYLNEPIRYIKVLLEIFKQNQYRIVHSHMNTLSAFPLLAAKLAGVPIRITHSHSTASSSEGKRALLKIILRPTVTVFATHLFACSEYAGKWMFGKRQFYVMRNGIEIDRFKFDDTKRVTIRNRYGINADEFAIGHVGRFMFQKNHEFLVRVFAKLPLKKKKLMLVGDGELMDAVKKQVIALGIEDKVIFVGSVADTAPFYSAFDVFCLPSRFEGLAVVRVEALSAGCPCLVSAGQTEELGDFDEGFLAIDDVAAWVKAVVEKRNAGRSVSAKRVRDCGFDISYNAVGLGEKYLEMTTRIPLLTNKKELIQG
jgi:glycosyltransferase EpsF